MIPIAFENPATVWNLRRKRANAVRKFLRRFRIAQLHRSQARATIEKMHVCIVEARHDAAALQINQARLCACEFANVFRCADGDDAMTEYGDSFGFGLLFIDCPNFAIEQHQIGVDLRERRARQTQPQPPNDSFHALLLVSYDPIR